MSQERILKFLKEHKETWFNKQLIIAGIILEDKLDNFDYTAVEITTNRALLKLCFNDLIERKVHRVYNYYRFKAV
jgi:hypothetical protein